MRLGIFALALCALVLCFGCANNKPNIGGENGPKITKIISLSPSTTEIIGGIGLTQAIVGRTSSCDYPKDLNAPVVVTGTKPDFEKIAKMEPDLVVYDKSLYTNTDLEKLNTMAKQVIPMEANTIEDLMNYILQVGGYCSASTNASELADKLYSARERARGSAPATKVRVAILSAGTGEYLAAGTDSFLADVVKNCGGTIVGPPGKQFATLSPEVLITGNPELVLVAGTDAQANQVLKDPRLASIAALKAAKPRVFSVEDSYLYRPGPKTATLIDDLSNKITKIAGDTQAK